MRRATKESGVTYNTKFPELKNVRLQHLQLIVCEVIYLFIPFYLFPFRLSNSIPFTFSGAYFYFRFLS